MSGRIHRKGYLYKQIIVQRSSHRFWNVIFRQVFDFSCQHVNVRFCGELGTEEGGPYRELLRLCMERFADTGCFLSPFSLVPSAASDKLHLRLY